MKKTLLSALVIIGMAFASCEKDNSVSPSSNKVQKTEARDKTKLGTYDGE